MSPDVLRRKLQKMAKHRPYGKCPVCGRRTVRRLIYEGDPRQRGCIVPRRWRLFRVCQAWAGDKCGWWRELFWSGGGTADTYQRPRGRPGKG
jgi:hypothetical protein